MAKKTQTPVGAAPGTGLEVWPATTVAPPRQDLKPTMGRPRSAKERPTLARLNPRDFADLIGVALDARPALSLEYRTAIKAAALSAANQAAGVVPLAAGGISGLTLALLAPVLGPPVPLLLDTDRMRPDALGWLSLVALVVELRQELAKPAGQVKAAHLAAGSGRSLAHCRIIMGSRRTVDPEWARLWLENVTRGVW